MPPLGKAGAPHLPQTHCHPDRAQRRGICGCFWEFKVAKLPSWRPTNRIIGPVGAREFSPGQVRLSERGPGLAAEDICSHVGAAPISQAGGHRRSPTHCHPDRAQRREIRGCFWEFKVAILPSWRQTTRNTRNHYSTGVSVRPVYGIPKCPNDYLIGQESLLNGSFFLSPKANVKLIVVCTSIGSPRNR